MSFLAPLFLLGAAAVALPILFHLARRTTQERIPFSSLMFLQPTPPRVTRRSRLEHWVLLALRCLAICLLALGFARPFIQRVLSLNASGGPGKRWVMLCDTSASMRREGLWGEVLTRASQVLARVGPADRLALYTFDKAPRAIVDFDEWNRTPSGDRAALVRARLTQLQPGWSATQLGGSLIAAAEAVEFLTKAARDKSETGPAEIVLITDLQEGSRLDGLQGYEWPPGVSVAVERVGGKSRSNAGLHWVADSVAEGAAKKVPAPRLRVSSAADSRREQLQVRWLTTAGAPNAAAPLDVYVPPGQSRTIQAAPLTNEWNGERLSLSGDEEPFDNTVYWIPPQAERLRVGYLGTEAENDPTASLYYLKRAFQETSRQSVQVTVKTPDQPLASADLADFQLLVLTGDLPASHHRVVRDFLTLGKTVLFALGDAQAGATLSGVLGLTVPVEEHAAPAGYVMWNRIDFEHPLFAPFADPRFSDFTPIRFWKHRRVGLEAVPAARVLCRFDDGDPAVVQFRVGPGQLFLMASSWRRGDSQLALSSKFVPLLYAAVELSRETPAFVTQYAVDDEVGLEWLKGKEPIRVRKPDGQETELQAGALKFTQTDLPGVYTASSGGRTGRFAVNLAAEESRTAPLPVEELERLKVPIAARHTDLAKKAQLSADSRLASEIESQQRLWRWLLVAALMVLMVETGLAGWFSRRALAKFGGVYDHQPT